VDRSRPGAARTTTTGPSWFDPNGTGVSIEGTHCIAVKGAEFEEPSYGELDLFGDRASEHLTKPLHLVHSDGSTEVGLPA